MNLTTQQFITNTKGQKTAVIIPIEQYEELIENLHDLCQINQRKNEPEISLKDAKKILK
jgi:hypothetical protein